MLFYVWRFLVLLFVIIYGKNVVVFGIYILEILFIVSVFFRFVRGYVLEFGFFIYKFN